jgi:addiction module HigA family antidote
VHPGRILTREMAARGLTGNALALKLRVPANRISEIVNGKRGISAETALRLGRYFGTGPELWVRLQADYDLAEVEREMGATVRREVETGCRLSFSTPIGPTRNSAPGCPPARAARAPRVSWTWAGSRRWPTVLQHP